jgi:hypothetical protein
MTREEALKELQEKYFEHPYAGYVKVSDTKDLINKIYDNFEVHNNDIIALVNKAERLANELRGIENGDEIDGEYRKQFQ